MPVPFLDGHYKEVFEKGFAKCNVLKLADSNFAVANGEYRYQTFWKGIPTYPNSLSCYALLFPELAVPAEIQFCDPHSDVEYLKSVVRDTRHKRFVAYLECRSKYGSFDFVLEAKFRRDENNFHSAKYKDNYTAGLSANMRCKANTENFIGSEDLVVAKLVATTQLADSEDLVPKKGLPTALRRNFPVFLVKPDLCNGLGVAR